MSEPDPLAEGDATAAELLAELEPLRFREAATAAEEEAAFRLRYRAVVEMGMLPATAFRDGRERDLDDAGAVQILGWEATRPIATCRLVLPAEGRPLPLETAFGVVLPAGHAIVEWGRVVVDPAWRGDGHSIFLGLAARGWLSMRARGYAAAVGATPKRLLALFDALGFAVTVIGPPRIYWGEERVPFLCEGRPTIRGLEKLRPQ